MPHKTKLVIKIKTEPLKIYLTPVAVFPNRDDFLMLVIVLNFFIVKYNVDQPLLRFNLKCIVYFAKFHSDAHLLPEHPSLVSSYTPPRIGLDPFPLCLKSLA